MLARKLMKAGETGPVLTTLWSDTFTVEVNTNIASHTPDIGTSYSATRCMNGGNVQAVAPAAIVNAVSDALEYNNTARGPIFTVNALVKKVSIDLIALATIGGVYLNVRQNLTTTGTLGVSAHVVSTAGVVRLLFGTTIVAEITVANPTGKTLSLYDDGTNGAEAFKLYIDDELLITYSGATARTAVGNYGIGVSLAAAGVRADNLLVEGILI